MEFWSVKSDYEKKRMPESTLLLQRGKKKANIQNPPKQKGLSYGFLAVINAVGFRDF